jgi:hypothetical protein
VIAAADDKPLGDIVAWAAHALEDQLGRGPKTGKTARATAYTEAKRAAILTALTDTLAARGPAKTLDALLDRYADAAGVAATPRPVTELMASLAGSDLGVVLDPASGTGELLEAALVRGAACVLGQELDDGLARLAEIRLGIAGRQGTAEVHGGGTGRRFAARRQVRRHPGRCGAMPSALRRT